jgi:1-acyl-sn-glycerol-3-phosphate acyltransferase
VLGTPETSIEMGASLSSLGFDSLMAVELMNRIDLDFGVEVPVMQLLQGPSIERLASSILDALQMAVGESQAVPETAMLQHGGAAQPSHQILQDVPDALTLSQRAVQILLRSALRLVARIEVQGLEHIPHKGTVLLAGNHVNQFDALLLFAFAPRRVTAFAAAYLETRRWKGWFMSRMLNAIYVVRGESDQTAIATAIEVLRGGGVVAIAPEGTRSGTGVLGRAHTGVAYLSGASLAPVVPVVAYGQEGAITYWRSLRRVPIFVAVGRPVQAHDGPVTGAALEGYTARVMRQIASLLPPAYRGMWSD